jgi:N6-L-threonylcarbamoyladenine synthase
MIILSIETSCDDTSVALIEAESRKTAFFNALSNIVSSQTKIHAPYGGVVPSLAARAHQRNLPVVLIEALEKFKVQSAKLKTDSIFDLITVTNGPGLEPSLWAGVNFAKSLSLVSGIPIVGVNHIEGHIYANFVNKISVKPEDPNQKSKYKFIKFPALCLIVSGGHTQLVLMKNHGKYKLLGETRDDAAGEAFDKVAKLLGLGYPGGPIISKLADKVLSSKSQVLSFKLPRPMVNSKDYDFSFSGLKTAVLYTLWDLNKTQILNSKFKEEICAEFQQSVIDVLLHKTLRAAKQHKVKSLLCGGGVMANKELRGQLKIMVQDKLPGISLHIPPIDLCTDNAVMTGIAGYYKFSRDGADKMSKIKVDGNLKL